MQLSDYPRVRFGHLPTPLELMPRLSAELGGPDLWIKRDDCTGLGFGGNKTRKLEFLVGAAQAEGADTLITFGALQSNHVRQTAAAAAHCGMKAIVFLVKQVPYAGAGYNESGNLMLDHLFGAEVHAVDDDEAAGNALMEVLGRLEAEGRHAYLIPPGGSNETGSLGYVAAGVELAEQFQQQGVSPAAIMLATSTGGTQAGLLAGLQLAGCDVPIEAFNVYSKDVAKQKQTITEMGNALTAALAGDKAGPVSVILHDDVIGPGYGLPTDAMREAVSLLAQTEGILIDPVYTGKAFGGLIAQIRAGRFKPGEQVVFLHTGGAPGLFAYGDDFGA